MKNKIPEEMKEYLISISPYINYRSFLKINENFSVELKSPNFALPLISCLDKMDEVNKDIISKLFVWKNEKQNVKKIDRMTNVSVENLKRNLRKTLIKSETTFAIRYAFELYCREKDSFNEIIVNYSLLTTQNKYGCFYTYSLLNFLGKTNDREIIEIIISALIKYVSILPITFENSMKYSSDEVYRKAYEIKDLYLFNKMSLDNLYRALLLIDYKDNIYENIVHKQYKYFEEDEIEELQGEYTEILNKITDYHIKNKKS